jgi:hypothetical protein
VEGKKKWKTRGWESGPRPVVSRPRAGGSLSPFFFISFSKRVLSKTNKDITETANHKKKYYAPA